MARRCWLVIRARRDPAIGGRLHRSRTRSVPRAGAAVTCRAWSRRSRAPCTASSVRAAGRARFRRPAPLPARARQLPSHGAVAQVDHQRAQRRIDVGRRDQHRRFFFVLVRRRRSGAGCRRRRPCPTAVRPALRPVPRRAPAPACTDPGVVRLARQFAHQPQRLVAEARLGDQVEIGARHRGQATARSISHCDSRPTGRPVAMPRLPSSLATPAMSRCAQRWPSVKRARKQPAVIAPAQRPPML